MDFVHEGHHPAHRECLAADLIRLVTPAAHGRQDRGVPARVPRAVEHLEARHLAVLADAHLDRGGSVRLARPDHRGLLDLGCLDLGLARDPHAPDHRWGNLDGQLWRDLRLLLLLGFGVRVRTARLFGAAAGAVRILAAATAAAIATAVAGLLRGRR